MWFNFWQLKMFHFVYRTIRSLWLWSHRQKWPKICCCFFPLFNPFTNFYDRQMWQIQGFQIWPRSFSYMVLNQIHARCFSMWSQSEWSCHTSSNFYVTEVGVCRSLPIIIIIVLMPTGCSLKLGTVVTEFVLSFNYCFFYLSFPEWLRIYTNMLN